MILGQETLIEKLDKFTLSDFPKTILLQGLRGSGKHLICNYISSKFNIPLEDISKSINIDKIEEIGNRVEPYLYIIDMNILLSKNKLDKEQSVLLKFIEEPLANSFIIILCEAIDQVLPTILNRCIVFNMNSYSRDILMRFTDSEDNNLILTVAKTPGQILEIKGEKLSDILTFANKIIDNILKVPYYNALRISDKIAFDNEKDKYPLDILLSLILHTLVEKIRVNDIDIYYIMYNYFNKLYNQIKKPYINKKYLFENTIFSIKQRFSN